eukprot:2804993-Rhodomonas_salina.2
MRSAGGGGGGGGGGAYEAAEWESAALDAHGAAAPGELTHAAAMMVQRGCALSCEASQTRTLVLGSNCTRRSWLLGFAFAAKMTVRADRASGCQECGLHDVLHAIAVHHGGFHLVARKLGLRLQGPAARSALHRMSASAYEEQ